MKIIRSHQELDAEPSIGFRYKAEGKEVSTYKTIAGVKATWTKLQKPGGGCDGYEPVAIDLSIGGWHESKGFALYLRDKSQNL